MAVDYQVPFFANTDDDTHCLQAALKMVVKYWYPNEEYSWEDLDSLSAKVDGLWTWPTAALLWLKRKGLNVKVISPFEYQSFISRGGDFLVEKYGQEVGHAQIEHSSIPQEQQLASDLIRAMDIDARIPELQEIIVLLEEEYLVICNVNSQLLNGRDGYTGHFVVVKGYSSNKIILHDPGNPPQENRSVTLSDFEKAWSYPNQEARGIYAIKGE